MPNIIRRHRRTSGIPCFFGLILLPVVAESLSPSSTLSSPIIQKRVIALQSKAEESQAEEVQETSTFLRTKSDFKTKVELKRRRLELIEDLSRARQHARKIGEAKLNEETAASLEEKIKNNIHGFSAAKKPAIRPNLVWVMADDLGYGEPGLFKNSASGKPHIDTPNMDQFGREGMIFKNAYAGYSSGAPSRTAFFMGRHSGEFWNYGLTGNTITPIQGKQSLPVLLKGVGYRTGAFGKLAPIVDPTKTGFDAFVGQLDNLFAHNMYPQYLDSKWGRANMEINSKQSNCESDKSQCHHVMDVIHAEAMIWMASVATSSDPFFLFLSYTAPRAGGFKDSPDDKVQGQPVPSQYHYASESWPEVEKNHAAAVSLLDLKLGDLLKNLKDLGVDEDTLVFFASDNGAHAEGGHDPSFFDSSGSLRGGKFNLYEGGIRSPTMARWPARITAGSESDYMWAFWDVLPTFGQLAGFDEPGGLEGKSFAISLVGKTPPEKEYVYFTAAGQSEDMPDLSGVDIDDDIINEVHLHKSSYTIRKGNWKGVVRACQDTVNFKPSQSDEMELYDLLNDPGEASDVAASNTDALKQLKDYVVSKDFTCFCFACGWNTE